MADEILRLEGISKHFGGLSALQEVSFSVEGGEALGLVGPNGSGKTTLINVVCGLYTPNAGNIYLEGAKLGKTTPHKLAKSGINRTFQVPQPFASLTVRENVEIAAAHRRGDGMSVVEILDFVNLGKWAGQEAGSLNAAQQKRLDLGRALALNPKVLFVDELGAGLNPAELAEVAAMLRSLLNGGRALVVVEHLMGFLDKLVDRVIVLNAGREIFHGGLRSALDDGEVKRVFLGTVGA